MDGGELGDPTAREMTHTGDAGNPPLLYQLFRDSTRNDFWGIFPGQSLDLNEAATGNPMVFGRVLGGQNSVVPGSYRDEVTINLTIN